VVAVSVSREDVHDFVAASHDVNPLHTSASYARRTFFGRPVVHGVLGALVAFGTLSRRSGTLVEATIDFRGPIFEDTSYQVDLAETSAKTTVKLMDGGRALLNATLVFGEGVDSPLMERDVPRPRERARTDAIVADGQLVIGAWAPALAPLRALCRKYDLPARGIHEARVAAMMCASYVVGMEVPGEQALFSHVRLTFPSERITVPTDFSVRVTTYDERFAMLTLEARLPGGSGEIRALLRPRPMRLDLPRLERALGRNLITRPLIGKSAVVVGGGRGLGAAIAVGLARAGARVTATYVGDDESAQVLTTADERIEVRRTDAMSAEACSSLASDLGRGADVLVLSASPPVASLSLSHSSLERFTTFVTHSIAMVSVPLCHLAANAHSVVLISSSYVEAIPADFAHYVTAKSAVEGLLRAYARDHPKVKLIIVRPPRVLTDMTNTPFGSGDALPAELVAARIVRAVIDESAGSPPSILAHFDDTI